MKGVNNFYNVIFSGCNIRVVKQSSTNVLVTPSITQDVRTFHFKSDVIKA